MPIKVIKPGLLTTVQDLGRFGYRQQGVLVSGAMDATAHRVANLLVGNPEQEATVEFTLLGPSLRFEADQVIALTGASFAARLDGLPVQMNRRLQVKKGALLEVGQAVRGCRGYLAVAGGIQVPVVMGSRSTYLRAGLGGVQGAPLQRGQVVPCLAGGLGEEKERNACFSNATWYPAPFLFPDLSDKVVLRTLKGPEYEWFSPECQGAFWEQYFTVSPQSDRMGYRLQGPVVSLERPREVLSTAVTFGTVQVPSAGNPIVLMADHQTTGGYPRIAQVISADFSSLAQAVPGQQILFKEVTLAEAQAAYLQQERDLARLKNAIALKLTK